MGVGRKAREEELLMERLFETAFGVSSNPTST